MLELLDELDVIEIYKQPWKRSYVEEMTEKQKALYGFMGVEMDA
jgi:hypothetical protein